LVGGVLFHQIYDGVLNVVYSCCFVTMDSEGLGGKNDQKEVLQGFDQKLKRRVFVKKEGQASSSCEISDKEYWRDYFASPSNY
jgi:hypothetical protein